jgi:hypothetical protein
MQAPAGVEFRKITDGGERLETALAAATHPHNEPAAAVRFREVLAELGTDAPPLRRTRSKPPAGAAAAATSARVR